MINIHHDKKLQIYEGNNWFDNIFEFTDIKNIQKLIPIGITGIDISNKVFSYENKVIKIIEKPYSDNIIGNSIYNIFSHKSLMKYTLDKTLELLDLEIKYNKNMDSEKIGPKIYDTFCVIYKNAVVQYMISEKYDNSVLNFLILTNMYDLDKSKQIVNNMFIQMTDLLKKQIVNKLYCTDIKPANFVYKKHNTTTI